MNNFEKIKSMTIEEMASRLSGVHDCCDYCAYDNYSCVRDCAFGIKKFLESEVE